VAKDIIMKETSKVTVGVDLGDKHSFYCVVGGDGGVLEEGKLVTTSAGFQQRFASMASARVLLEVGMHSPWVSRLLKDHGHEVVVVDPRKLDLIAQSEKKTDRHDASTLALLGRLDTNLQLLKTVDHRSQEMQADLAAIRNRDALVRSRTLLINTIRGTVKSYGGRLPACSAAAFPKKALVHIPPPLSRCSPFRSRKSRGSRQPSRKWTTSSLKWLPAVTPRPLSSSRSLESGRLPP
jgi:transposase